jgi:hypothetical protein
MFGDFLNLTSVQKRKLPVGLQQLWRLHRGLCPIHGMAMSMNWEDHPNWPTVDFRVAPVPLECPVAGCTAKVSAMDWNYPEHQDKPWCVGSVQESEQCND